MKPYDILFFGWLFLANLILDSYLIIANPAYALKIFGGHFNGWLGWAAKIQSPVLHGLIGVGFIRRKRWGFILYMIYAAFGMANAVANTVVLGFGRIRTVFIISLLVISIYIYFRRNAFDG